MKRTEAGPGGWLALYRPGGGIGAAVVLMIPLLIAVYCLLPPFIFIVGVAIWYMLAARTLFPIVISDEPIPRELTRGQREYAEQLPLARL